MLQDVLGLSHLDNFHFIGHSLGAHLGGYCGHALQRVSLLVLYQGLYRTSASTLTQLENVTVTFYNK